VARSSPPSLARLIRPRSVAVVGASDKPGALGASVIANLDRAGFSGSLHLINPNRDEIGGRPCLKTIDDLPSGVDVAVLAIPRVGVLDAVRRLAEREVGAAIIFSAGFAEGGEQGLADQREIARIAATSGMVIEGPNCLGLINFVDDIPLTFVEMPKQTVPAKGVAIVSQSGAMAAVVAMPLMASGLGLTYSVSTGNEAASGVEDYVDWLVDDPHTNVIAMIVEQFRNPRRFLTAASRARAAGKTIVLLHPGKSSAARESAATHTGAMAGDYQVMRLLVARAGVIFAETLEELGDIVEIVQRCPSLPAGGPAIMGESGAFKALMLDLAEGVELPLPVIGDADSPALRAALPPFVGVTNPLDLTAQGLVDPDMYTRTLHALLGDARFSSILVGLIQTDRGTCDIKFPPVLRCVTGERLPKPVIVAGLDEGATGMDDYVSALRAAGVPYFPSSERALRALARLTVARDVASASSDAAAIKLPGLAAMGGIVPEYRAKLLLSEAGLPFPKGRLAISAEEAQDAADALGYPVVLKAQAADLPHKSDAGGVILGLGDRAAVAAAWDQLHANVATARPGLQLDGALVEAMGARGVELIVGARNDPDWGPVLLAGLGGVQAELLQDVRLLPHDLPKADIVAELNRLRSAALLNGFRGAPPCDVEAAASLIAKLGRVMAGEPRIAEIDLNPVILLPRGEGVVVLDALIRLSDGGM